ncbi:Uncharacterised protein [Mycobacteroides abscessus subsp. massiliense]|uniref:hypothetical protein n=1 Tax=Mycobacteroides abscessus TaxID=36809 RepID=UPI0009A807BB|nr:hypothetical protein [Mycobacteroides abscessus]SKI79752.1 Uncharacterised protein [Mycobacteroides abscessus subsp. massiliense]
MPQLVDTWVYTVPEQTPTVIQHFDGLASITLSKLPDGTARLLWVFDEDYPEQLGLFVHLTDKEAQEVFETPAPEGLLERVRHTLTYPDAILWRSNQRVMSAQFIEIPREGDEDALWDHLGRLVEGEFPYQVDMRQPVSASQTVASNLAQAVANTRAYALV